MCENVIKPINWLSVKIHVFSTFQTNKNIFFTEVVLCHFCNLKGFGCTESQNTVYLQNPF